MPFFILSISLKNKLPQSLLLVGAEMFSCDESKFYEAHSTCIIFFLLESINGKFHATKFCFYFSEWMFMQVNTSFNLVSSYFTFSLR